jgi:hypothetical protein
MKNREDKSLSYHPHPIDTTTVTLPAEIALLIELLAKNIHDNWAARRMSDGWRFGSTRDDPKKKHPSLIPYEQLSDSEKEYDRKTATETIKTIQMLGYRISK